MELKVKDVKEIKTAARWMNGKDTKLLVEVSLDMEHFVLYYFAFYIYFSFSCSKFTVYNRLFPNWIL